MQMGFNNDVEYEGFTLHIQTEDHGLRSMKITSQVFQSGAIFDSKTVSYEQEIARFDAPKDRDEHIRRMMKALHRRFYKKIHAGEYNERLGLAPPVTADAPEIEVHVEVEAEDLGAAVEAEAAGAVDDGFVPTGLDIPMELLEAEGFRVAGEQEALGAVYEAHSRGPAMDPAELAVDPNAAAWLGVPDALLGAEAAFADALVDLFGGA